MEVKAPDQLNLRKRVADLVGADSAVKLAASSLFRSDEVFLQWVKGPYQERFQTQYGLDEGTFIYLQTGSLSLVLLACDAVDLSRRVVALVCAGLAEEIKEAKKAAAGGAAVAAAAGGGAQGWSLSVRLACSAIPLAASGRCALRSLDAHALGCSC